MAPSRPSDLLAEREGWPLRGAEGGCAAARLEQGPKAHTALGQKSKMGPHGPHFQFLAEREGFEPSVRYHRTPTFQAGTLNHSATSPKLLMLPADAQLPERITGGASLHTPSGICGALGSARGIGNSASSLS